MASTEHEEKGQYTVGRDSPTDHSAKDIVESKGHAIGEAAGIYGDVQTAEEYGYVERGYVFRDTRSDIGKCR
jgi:amino acid transporter